MAKKKVTVEAETEGLTVEETAARVAKLARQGEKGKAIAIAVETDLDPDLWPDGLAAYKAENQL